jgi:hypothetical protein
MSSMQLHTREAGIHHYFGAASETGDHRFDIFLGHRVRLTKLAPGQPQFDRRGRLGVTINDFLALATRVADLRPKMISGSRPRRGPALQGNLHRNRRLRINNDVPRTLEVITIHLNIA